MYELIVIAKTDEAEGKVEKHLKDLAAVDVKSQKMGRKQLAYPVAKVTEAEYFSWTFDAPGEGIVKLNSLLRLEQEDVLRYLITIAPKVSQGKKVTKEPTVLFDKVPLDSSRGKPEEPRERPKVTVTTRIKTSQKGKVSVKSAGREKGTIGTKGIKSTKGKK